MICFNIMQRFILKAQVPSILFSPIDMIRNNIRVSDDIPDMIHVYLLYNASKTLSFYMTTAHIIVISHSLPGLRHQTCFLYITPVRRNSHTPLFPKSH